jgi:hypothetical protein
MDDRPGNPQINLRIPDAEMFAALMRDAKKKKTTVQAVIWEIVAAHYEIEVTAPARGRPKKSVEE